MEELVFGQNLIFFDLKRDLVKLDNLENSQIDVDGEVINVKRGLTILIPKKECLPSFLLFAGDSVQAFFKA